MLPIGNRHVHAGIAPDANVAVRHGSAPLLQYDEGVKVWNHGEGFAPGTASDLDFGGWFGDDDGQGVDINNVHTPFGWVDWTWTSQVHAASGTGMRRLYGFLRPTMQPQNTTMLPLPTEHPLYGTVGNGPFATLGNADYPANTYVDQAAFELFIPMAAPGPNDTILICIQVSETTQFPKDFEGNQYSWFQLYRGFFSPDGLVRNEGSSRTPAAFESNLGVEDVVRPDPLIIVGPWAGNYYPIFGYAVTSVARRQTTLNEQRDLQLLQAIKCILMEPPSEGRNPLPTELTPSEIDTRVVVVFMGGSNGGLQSMWAALRYPELVHGNLSVVMNPSAQRFLGEFDMKHAIAHLSGSGPQGSSIDESDFLHWGQYAWNQGRWIHDTSQLMRHLLGALHRPASFVSGDEDITSTGTDWARVLSGNSWQATGVVPGNSPLGSSAANRVSWSIGDKACHGPGLVKNPYTSVMTFHGPDIVHDLALDAIAQHAALAGAVLPPPPASEPRSTAQELRGLDDPHEWALGRKGAPMTAGAALSLDYGWSAATQQGAAGTMLGFKEAMLIRDGSVFVGSAEGMVTKFEVAGSATQELVKVAQSHDPNTGLPMSLGHQAYAMTASGSGSSWELVVGTRRHLHRLDPDDLTVIASTQIPWEIAQPRHLKYVSGNILPAFPGPKLVFCSKHGGLAFYEPDLSPVYEWPEPGIADFMVQGSNVTILSHRGVVATVAFPTVAGAPAPELSASSKPISRKYLEYWTGAPNPALDSPCQGVPHDIELMVINNPSGGQYDFVSSWLHDTDKGAVRSHRATDLTMSPLLDDLGVIFDIATCRMPSGYVKGSQDDPGTHLLVLAGGAITLFDQTGAELGRKVLNGSGLGYYPFGTHARAMVVGELVPGGGAGGYTDEVVIATHSGSLMWMHVNDILASTTDDLLPSPTYDTLPGSAIQPRTNLNLSATWAVSKRDDDSDLHMLDPRGAYWRVTGTGGVSLVASNSFAKGARGWSDLGNRDANGVHQDLSAAATFDAGVHLTLYPVAPNSLTAIVPMPWSPKATVPLLYEQSNLFISSNWHVDEIVTSVFEGFAVYPWTGDVVTTTNGPSESWYWSSRGVIPGDGDWGNLVQGLRVDLTPSEVIGTWASTGIFNANNDGKCEHHLLRSFVTETAALSQQSLQAIELSDGTDAVVLVLGLPGGRVRVQIPGSMRVDDSTAHELAMNSFWESHDLGFGGCGLAVREDAPGELTIWFGTIADPAARPALPSAAASSLSDGSVAAGAVHRLTWTASAGLSLVASKVFYPNATGVPRGGYGVVGLEVADILGGVEDELIVGTLGGEIIVLTDDLATVLWRANVPGSIGYHNAIWVDDLDGIPGKELYASGSFGVWRFK